MLAPLWSLAKQPHSLHVSKLWGNRAQWFTTWLIMDLSEQLLFLSLSHPTSQQRALRKSNSHASSSVDLLPPKILLPRAISSLISLPVSLPVHSPQQDDISVLISQPSHTRPESPAFPTSICRNRTEFSSACGSGFWMREAAECCRLRTDPGFPAAWPWARHYISELQFIIRKWNNSLSHILRILYTTKGG